jgi:hypothetical protein
MTPTNLIKTIGDILTGIDVLLQNSALSASDWQQLWALRKHLDDQQRELVASEIDASTAEYQALTAKLGPINQQLVAALNDIAKVGDTIKMVSDVASIVDSLLRVV